MPAYTPPSSSAVNFKINRVTPKASRRISTVASSTTPPASSAVNFSLVAYALPDMQSISFYPGGSITGFSTVDITSIKKIAGVSMKGIKNTIGIQNG
jgi:hypothetical protein